MSNPTFKVTDIDGDVLQVVKANDHYLVKITATGGGFASFVDLGEDQIHALREGLRVLLESK